MHVRNEYYSTHMRERFFVGDLVSNPVTTVVHGYSSEKKNNSI